MTLHQDFNATDPESPVVTVHKVNECCTVRWYPDVWSAERNHVMMTASHAGVSIHTRYLHQIPDAWLRMANALYAQLRDDPYADVSNIATHVNSVTSNGPLVPIGGGISAG